MHVFVWSVHDKACLARDIDMQINFTFKIQEFKLKRNLWDEIGLLTLSRYFCILITQMFVVYETLASWSRNPGTMLPSSNLTERFGYKILSWQLLTTFMVNNGTRASQVDFQNMFFVCLRDLSCLVPFKNEENGT